MRQYLQLWAAPRDVHVKLIFDQVYRTIVIEAYTTGTCIFCYSTPYVITNITVHGGLPVQTCIHCRTNEIITRWRLKNTDVTYVHVACTRSYSFLCCRFATVAAERHSALFSAHKFAFLTRLCGYLFGTILSCTCFVTLMFVNNKPDISTIGPTRHWKQAPQMPLTQ